MADAAENGPAGAAPTPLAAELRRLLGRSLVAWRVLGRVAPPSPGNAGIGIEALGRSILIEPAAPGLPYRWMVTVDGRRRPAVSVVAVLRQVRLALDPGYAKTRVRIAPMPVLPPESGDAA